MNATIQREFLAVTHRHVNRMGERWTLVRFVPQSRKALWLVRGQFGPSVVLTVQEDHDGSFIDPFVAVGCIVRHFD